MTKFEWNHQPSGLRLRKDDFSWQASFDGDNRFFLRRELQQSGVLTDLLCGDLADRQVADLLAEFLSTTGGITEPKVIFTNIAPQAAAFETTVASYDRIVVIAKLAIAALGLKVGNAHLDQQSGRWDAVLTLAPTAVAEN